MLRFWGWLGKKMEGEEEKGWIMGYFGLLGGFIRREMKRNEMEGCVGKKKKKLLSKSGKK